MKLYKLTDTLNKKENPKLKFTHGINEDGALVAGNYAEKWDNVMLLDGKRDNLYQYLVWDDSRKEYFVLLSKNLYTE